MSLELMMKIIHINVNLLSFFQLCFILFPDVQILGTYRLILTSAPMSPQKFFLAKGKVMHIFHIIHLKKYIPKSSNDLHTLSIFFGGM